MHPNIKYVQIIVFCSTNDCLTLLSMKIYDTLLLKKTSGWCWNLGEEKPSLKNWTCLFLSHLLAVALQGYFSDTLMYYGYYSNSSINKSCDADTASSASASNTTSLACTSQRQPSYKISLAYFFTIQGAFFITCIILVYRCGSTTATAPRSYRPSSSWCHICVPLVFWQHVKVIWPELPHRQVSQHLGHQGLLLVGLQGHQENLSETHVWEYLHAAQGVWSYINTQTSSINLPSALQ